MKRSVLRWVGLSLPVMALSLFLLTGSSCSGKKAEELFKTAQFEELQTNWEHAGQIYEKILADYPKSGVAGKAKSSLEKLSLEGKYRPEEKP